MRNRWIGIVIMVCIGLFGCNREDGHAHEHATPRAAEAAPTIPATPEAFVQQTGSGLAMFLTMADMASKGIKHEADRKIAAEIAKQYAPLQGELEALAKQKNLTMVDEPQGHHRSVVEGMFKLQGEAFEEAFHDVMQREHATLLAQLEGAGASLNDPEIKAFVEKATPLLRLHHDELKKHAAEHKHDHDHDHDHAH